MATYSPAIDYCYQSSVSMEDMDGQPRGVDNPYMTDFQGTYDIGAYEFVVDDLIFMDGFE